jgi:hypothetical protein
VAFSGLIVRALARLALPGRDPMTIFQTVVCALVLVFAIRRLRERQLARPLTR